MKKHLLAITLASLLLFALAPFTAAGPPPWNRIKAVADTYEGHPWGEENRQARPNHPDIYDNPRCSQQIQAVHATSSSQEEVISFKITTSLIKCLEYLLNSQ
jgi:hypothetical protein